MPTGRVAIFTTSGVPFDIVELPTPEVEPGGLLVKNTHAVICGSDFTAGAVTEMFRCPPSAS